MVLHRKDFERNDSREEPDMPDGRSGTMTSLTKFVLRHRKWVIGFWLVMLVAGGAAGGQLSNRLSLDFSLPGQPGYEAGQQIMHRYGNGGGQAPSILVVRAPAGQTVRGD